MIKRPGGIRRRLIMLGSAGEDLEGPPPDDLRAARSSIYVGTPDVEAIHARAREAGTEVTERGITPSEAAPARRDLLAGSARGVRRRGGPGAGAGPRAGGAPGDR